MDPNTNDIDQQLTGLADPLRRALYRHVTERGEPVSRDDAALADLLASAVAADPSGTTQAALHHAAATLGTDLATQAATPHPQGRPSPGPGHPPPGPGQPRLRTLQRHRRHHPPAQPPLRPHHHPPPPAGLRPQPRHPPSPHRPPRRPPPTHATLDPQPRRCCVVLTREGCA
ncbi:MAG: hypothetical protein ACJ75K_20695 [Actinomycetes bacterium]